MLMSARNTVKFELDPKNTKPLTSSWNSTRQCGHFIPSLPYVTSNDQAHLPGPLARPLCRAKPVLRPRSGAAPGSAALSLSGVDDAFLVIASTTVPVKSIS